MDKVTDNLLFNAGSLADGEKCIILFDCKTREVAKVFEQKLTEKGFDFCSYCLPFCENHGEEPPAEVAAAMKNADLIVCLTSKSLAHSAARKEANDAGTRFLSMPDYSLELLKNPALSVDYREYYEQVSAVTRRLDNGKTVHITSKAGTDFYADINGRNGNCCPGFTDSQHLLASPPDIEANIAPIEDKSYGRIAVDGSITCDEIGLLKTPVYMNIENGKVVSFECEDKKIYAVLEQMFQIPERRTVGEIGIGFNKKAELCGNMLVDEGTAGCIHFGFGSNATIGGKNKTPFHMDFVIRNPEIEIF